jgi:DNA-binding MarR family transcriptional regulator
MASAVQWYLDVAQEIFGGMGAQTNASITGYIEEKNLQDMDLAFVQIAKGIAPEPLTAPSFVARAPYANPAMYADRLAESVERGWLKAGDDGAYFLSEAGEKIAEEIFAMAEDLFTGIESLSETDLVRITELLKKVVKKAMSLPEPAVKTNMDTTRVFDRGSDVSIMLQLRRQMIYLNAFRDDSHVAAFMPVEADGQIWEALTFVWREDANTAAKLAEVLPYRGYDEDSYAVALKTLEKRGWVEVVDGAYAVTTKGKEIREAAEAKTNTLFDTAWEVLAADEVEELQALLKKLAEAVTPEAEEPEEA